MICSSPLRPFAPSLHVARILLSQLFLRQEQARNQTRYAMHFPVTELNVLPPVPLMAGNINFVAHVDLPWGVVRPPRECQQLGVVDASESFASVLHEEVINHARLFVARLDRHADLPDGLVLVALRTADFSTLVRSELRCLSRGCRWMRRRWRRCCTAKSRAGVLLTMPASTP